MTGTSTFPIDNLGVVEKVGVETDLDGTEEILINVGGVWKKTTLAILAELVEDLLA